MRRADLLVSGTALALIAALIGTPIWDYWHYRTLRSSPGSQYPVGLILPRYQQTTAAAATPETPLREAMPSPAPRTTTSPIGVASTSRIPADTPGLNPDRASQARKTHVADEPLIRSQPYVTTARGSSHPAIPVPAIGVSSQPGRGTPAEAGAQQAVVPAWGVWAAGMEAEAPSTAPTPPSDAVRPPAKPSGSGALRPEPTEPEPQGPAIISLQPEPQELHLGDSLTVSLVITDAQRVTSLPFHLLFQPEILEFTSSEIGPAVPGSLQPILLASVNPNRPGDLAVGLSFVESAGSYTGGGVVLVLHFRSVGAGITALEFDRASLRGPTSQPVEAQFQNLAITVL